MTLDEKYMSLRRQAIHARLNGHIDVALAYETRADQLHDRSHGVSEGMIERCDNAASLGLPDLLEGAQS